MTAMLSQTPSFTTDLCRWNLSHLDTTVPDFTTFGGCKCSASPGRYCRQGHTDAFGTPCPAGTFSSGIGAFECVPCGEGQYTSNRGQDACSRCPFPLSSGFGSESCAVCEPGFFLLNSSAAADDPASLLLAPSEAC
eukprot:1171869-Rhodomonas_salina.1